MKEAVIVGCGLAGSVAARILHDKGWKVTVLETRNHIGGNCFDSYLNDVLVHNYGPHTFHTNIESVWKFISRFTAFNSFTFRVLANTKRGLVPIPFNKTTESLVGNLSDDEIKDLLFKDYSEKQWGTPWDEIPEEITSRVPTRRDNYDDRYFCDKYQGIPVLGYTKMFESLLKDIPIKLSCDKSEYKKVKFDLMVYTGKLDEYFDFCFDRLPYRSLRFEHILSNPRKQHMINECNSANRHTRSYDQSHWLSQKVSKQLLLTNILVNIH